MKVGLIADDLTGANGTGVILVKKGLTAVTRFQTKQMDCLADNTVICIDTDSRYIKPQEAKQKVKNAALDLLKCNIDILCKRIDSTFRGNIGQEIDGILECNDSIISIVVPSYPALKRKTVGGYLFIDGTLLQETDVAHDPIKPICSSYLPDLLKYQTNYKISLIESDTICHGREAIKEEIIKKVSEGCRIIICDAITEKHIREIAKAMASIRKYRLVPADPGPLTSYFIDEHISCQTVVNNQPDQQKSIIQIKNNKILVSVGSVTTLTGKQLLYLSEKVGVTPIHVNPEHLIFNDIKRQLEISRIRDEALTAQKSNSIIIVTTGYGDCPKLNLKEISLNEGIPEEKLASRISEGLADISSHILRDSNQSIKGCLFSGGDVTASFCRVVEAEGIMLMSEVMPLIAHGKIIGRSFNGLHIVTKGGLVGGETAMLDCVRYLEDI